MHKVSDDVFLVHTRDRVTFSPLGNSAANSDVHWAGGRVLHYD
jgi:hypothetical protein